VNGPLIIGIVISLVAGAVIGYLLRQLQIERAVRGRMVEAERMIDEAQAQTKEIELKARDQALRIRCLLYTSPSPRDRTRSRMPSSA